MKRNVTVTTLLSFPPARVWRAIATAEGLSSWLMPASTDPKLGEPFMFRMKQQRGWDGTTYCEVLALDPGRELAMTYRGKATGDKAVRCAGIDSEIAQASVRGIFAELDTVLRFTLVPDPTCAGVERTRLIIEQSGFVGFKMVLVSFIMQMGWRKLARTRLPAALAAADDARAEAAA